MELPHPPRPDTPHETLSSDQFTIVQLTMLHQQLSTIAPAGVVMYKALVDTMHSLCHASVSVYSVSTLSLCVLLCVCHSMVGTPCQIRGLDSL